MKEGEKGLRGKERERKRGKKRKRKRKLRRLLSFFLPLSSADLSPSSLPLLPPLVPSSPLPSVRVLGPRLPGGSRAGGRWSPLAPLSKWRRNFPVPRPSIPQRRRIPSPVSLSPRAPSLPYFFPNPNSAASPLDALAGCPPGGRTNPSASLAFN